MTDGAPYAACYTPSGCDHVEAQAMTKTVISLPFDSGGAARRSSDGAGRRLRRGMP